MGMNRYKKTYKCDCGIDYGNCDRRNFFLLELSRINDVYYLYHKHHADEPESKLEKVLCFGENAMTALKEIFNCSESSESYDDSDHEEVKKIRGW